MFGINMSSFYIRNNYVSIALFLWTLYVDSLSDRLFNFEMFLAESKPEWHLTLYWFLKLRCDLTLRHSSFDYLGLLAERSSGHVLESRFWDHEKLRESLVYFVCALRKFISKSCSVNSITLNWIWATIKLRLIVSGEAISKLAHNNSLLWAEQRYRWKSKHTGLLDIRDQIKFSSH